MNFYKKTAALVLLLIYVFSATSMHEILKLPMLVEHYFDHRNENKNTSLVSFITMHYYAEDGTDKDAKEDKQLPFKTPENASSISLLSITPPSFIEVITKPETNACRTFGLRNDADLPSRYLTAIWQPPRHC